MALPDPRDHARALIVAGPYRNPARPDGHLIYEVAWILDGRYQATVAQCRSQRTAIARAKRERTLKKNSSNVPIFTRFPSEDPVLLKE